MYASTQFDAPILILDASLPAVAAQAIPPVSLQPRGCQPLDGTYCDIGWGNCDWTAASYNQRRGNAKQKAEAKTPVNRAFATLTRKVPCFIVIKRYLARRIHLQRRSYILRGHLPSARECLF